jgi:hypothetical protein
MPPIVPGTAAHHDPGTDLHRLAAFRNAENKKPRLSGVSCLEAEVGIEPAYADLQSAA